jgi:hypothetical protein
VGIGERACAYAVALRARRLGLVDPRDLARRRDAEAEARGPPGGLAANDELVDLERHVDVVGGRPGCGFEPRGDAASLRAS